MSRHEPLPLDGEAVVSTSQPANLESQVSHQVYWQRMRFEAYALPSRSGQSARPRSAYQMKFSTASCLYVPGRQ